MNIDMASTQCRGVRAWLRVFRPLLLWLVGFLLMLGYVKHQHFIERTRLFAAVFLAEREIDSRVAITLDGKPFALSERVSLGNHRLSIRCSKAVPFETNVFIWYGSNGLGRLELRRAQASLRVEVEPPAQILTLTGPEWQQKLTNSPGLTASVPTDVYRVTADYGHFSIEKAVEVVDGQGASCRIAPELGALCLTASRLETSFQLYRLEAGARERRIVLPNELPATLPLLQAGKYRVHAECKGLEKNWTLEIIKDRTNALEMDFAFGGVVLESTPAGATVWDEFGKNRGSTPLTLTAVPVGRWRGKLMRNGYLSVMIDLEVEANTDVTFRTNMVNPTYISEMLAAHRALEGGRRDYGAAITALTAALRQVPGDAVAETLLQQAQVGQTLQQAEKLANQRDHAGALQQAEAALAILPEHAEAKKLADEYRQAIQEKQAKDAEAARQVSAAARQRRPRDYFAELMAKTPFSRLFDQKELKVKGNLADIEGRIAQSLTNGQPAFSVLERQHPDADTFFIKATAKATGGLRQCHMVGGQSSEGEVTLLFEVFEYAYAEDFNLLSLVKPDVERKVVPVHSSRLDPNRSFLLARREEGIRLVLMRIQAATEGE